MFNSVVSPAPLRLGASTFMVQHWLAPEEVAVFESSPVTTLEIAPPWFWEASAEQEAATLAALRSSTVECWSVHAPFARGVDLSALDEEIRRSSLEALAEAFRFAGGLGCSLVVVHPSAEPIPVEERAARLERARASLAVVAEMARMEGVRAALEPLPRSCLGNTIAEMEALLEGMPEEHMGICLDVNHANVGQRLTDFIARLGPRILTLHISDNDGLDEKHWLPGEGVIDWQELVGALRRIGYRGPFLYEVGLGDKALAERLIELGANYANVLGR
ncbi:MAG: sugar phosphate isomerase/epimerase [Chloroflexi bacterium]|nr:sugar phosphate isomerase/epimerase [Chloroflexota bacterium]